MYLAHIFCTLLGIPHVLIDNSIKKLSNYYNTWTKSCPKAKFAVNLNEAAGLVVDYFENGW